MARKVVLGGRGEPLVYAVRLDRQLDREAALELGYSVSQLSEKSEIVAFPTDQQALACKEAISKLAAAKRKADRMRQHV